MAEAFRMRVVSDMTEGKTRRPKSENRRQETGDRRERTPHRLFRLAQFGKKIVHQFLGNLTGLP
jgi:hypothetical protein